MYRILAVDDEKNVLKAYRRIFMDAGFEVRYADSGEAALDAAVDFSPDVVLLDIAMPGMDGLDVCSRMKTVEALRETDVIFVSAKGELDDRLEGYRRGGGDYIAKPFDPGELLAKLHVVFERKRYYNRLVASDPLTGLGNRKLFEDRFNRFLELALRYHRPLSLSLMDLDHFKTVNDTHGHPAGDAVLKELSRRLRQETRKTDVVARIGGEEFAVLMPETDKLHALNIVERLRRKVASQPVAIDDDGLSVPVTVSIGLAAFPEDGASRKALYQSADTALYRAKQNGRNRTVAN